MKRWNIPEMLGVGQKLFSKIYRRKQAINHNHDIHFMAREITEWLPQGVASLLDGKYCPRPLRRTFFPDAVVDQLHLSDRIMQHILLKQIKPAFPHIVHPKCFHMHGPSGVKMATEHIREALKKDQPQFVIRADIKAFYSSIPHHKLVADIRNTFDDPKVQTMLEEIITNIIDTPRGFKNPGTGVALRGPLSQLFSAIYLKPLDSAFDGMDVTYARYQDDVIVLCKTRCQMNRCHRRMMTILQERGLRLSRKKSRKGAIDTGFHFLGVNWPRTRTEADTKVAKSGFLVDLLNGGGR